jgi:hypothetical protein
MELIRTLFPRRPAHSKLASRRLTVEALESRDLLSAYLPGPLVQVSSTSLFAGCYTPQPGDLINTEDENQLAVDPMNHNHLAALWPQDGILAQGGASLGQIVGISFDGGATWQLSPLPGITKCSGGTLPSVVDPWIVFAPNGDLYASSMAMDKGENQFTDVARSQILITKSTDGGLTWNTPTILADDAKHSVFDDKPTVTIDPADPNLVYAVWQRIDAPQGVGMRHSSPVFGLSGTKVTIQFRRSTDAGRTWEPVQTIYDPGANAVAAVNQIVVRPDGNLVDLFTETLVKKNNDGGDKLENHLSLLTSSDKGQTWLPRGTPIRTNQMVPTLVTDPENGVLVYTANPINDVSDVAVDPHSGTLYAVWQDSRFSGGQYTSIAFSQSTDGGATWSTPIAINQTPTYILPGNRQAFVPSIAVAEDGTVAVTYYDFRNNDANSTLLTDYWIVFGNPTTPTALTNPASWGGERRLSNQLVGNPPREANPPQSFDLEKTFEDGTLFIGEYEGLSAAGSDFVATFSQAVSDADPDSIFFRRISPGAALEAASIGHNGGNAALRSQQVDSLLPEAIHRWQAAGVDTSALTGIDIHIADLGGASLGLAAGHTIWLDADAAGWGWFVDPTPSDDFEFTMPGNQGEQHRMDLLTVLEHEVGHLLGKQHEAGGVMTETLSPGARRTPFAGSSTDWLAAVDVLFAEESLHKRR